MLPSVGPVQVGGDLRGGRDGAPWHTSRAAVSTAHATGLGKAMLAYSPAEVVAARVAAGLPALTPRTIVTPGLLARELSSIRERGVALDREESTVGLLCAAAPVLDGDGHVVGAISVSGISARLLDRSGLAVRTAALALGRRFAPS